MSYEVKDFSSLIGMDGFSEALLENHFKLYSGYVKNTNKVADALNAMLDEGKAGSYEYAEYKRRFGWEWNGMRLHELYFGNLGGSDSKGAEGGVKTAIESQFGNIENWEKDFRATGGMRGIGWVVLSRDPVGGLLVNSWINEHDVAHLAGASPLLVMDVFEHAFILDYGRAKGDYIDAFFKNIDWAKVGNRFDQVAK